MPLVANTQLPSFSRYRAEGGEVLTPRRAQEQSIRELHIGLFNMMPDAALEPTERQFLRLVGGCNRIAQFYIYPFTARTIPRGDKARRHIDQYYFQTEDIEASGLDALILSGANPVYPRLVDEAFWEPLCSLLDWARINVTSTLCACLATHAALLHFHGIERQPLPAKRWGVFSHQTKPGHPLVQGANTRFDVPHSRWNEIYPEQMNSANLKILMESGEAGVHLATSEDGFRFVYFQGHPEYDHNSLLKEYKREVVRYLIGEIKDYPSYPDSYFLEDAKKVLQRFQDKAMKSSDKPSLVDQFPETEIQVHNTWGDTGKVVVNNWLGTVYQITHQERRKPFMDGVDPANPLAYLTGYR